MANRHFEAATERQAMAQAIIDAMLTLPDDQWTVLYHRFFNSLTLSETARIVDTSLDKARKLEAQALRSMRQPPLVQILREYL